MLSYEELLKQYNILLCENKELKIQINKLREKLGISAETEKKQAFVTLGTAINRNSSTNEKISVYHCFGDVKMFSQDVGTVKQQKKADISLFVKMSGAIGCVTKENINARCVPIAIYHRLKIATYTSILKARTVTAEM